MISKRKVIDPALLDSLDNLESTPLRADVWRVTWAQRHPFVGSSGGGRWSPDGEFEAVYASFEPDGACAEAYYHLSRAPVLPSSKTVLNKIRVTLNNVLRLDSKDLRQAGISEPLASRIDYGVSQQIGAAAYLLDFEALMVPSARWDCLNLVLFLDRLDISQQLEILKSEPIDWPTWRSRTIENQQ